MPPLTGMPGSEVVLSGSTCCGCGSCASLAGKLTGRRPDGLTRPNNTPAIASPPPEPGYQASITAGTCSIQGNVTGPPVSSTTTNCGLTAATAVISAFCSSLSASPCASSASERHSSAKRITTSAFLACFSVSSRLSPLTKSTFSAPDSARMAHSGDDGWNTLSV